MPKYLYNALKNNSQLINGEIEADNLKDARQKIVALGFVPTKVYIENSNAIQNYTDNGLSGNINYKKIQFLSLQEKIIFTSELEVMLSSGIPILEALNTVAMHSPKKKLAEICSNLSISIMNGKTFSQAIESMYGEAFGTVYITLLRAGENSGELETVLARILMILRKQDNIKGKIISASIYPAILLLIMGGLILLFSKVVFPAFLGVITSFGGTVPFLAQLLIDICTFINNFWWFIIVFIVGMGYGISCLFKNIKIKTKWDNFILNIPVISDFIRYVNLANFMTILYVAYESGLPIMQALDLSNNAVGNNIIKRQVLNASKLIKNGKSFTDAFYSTGAIPGALMTMIAAGEKSGSLGKMLHDAADVIDKKVDMVLEALTRLFEPAVIITIGGIVLFVAVAFFQMYAGMLGSLF